MSELTAAKMREVWQVTKLDEHEWLDSFALEHWPALIAAIEWKEGIEAGLSDYLRQNVEFRGIAARVLALEVEVKRLQEIAQTARDEALEEAAKICWVASDELADRDDMTSEQGMAQHCAAAIRARIGKS